MTQKLRCLVCATSDRSVPSLEALVGAGHEIVGILARTRDEDDLFLGESSGDGVERWAEDHGIELRRSEDLSPEELEKTISNLTPDLGIVVDDGPHPPASVLEIPERGWIKEHLSLLPKHRGLHPVRSALWHGDRAAGVAIIEVTDEPDAGPILAKESLPIEDGEIWGELSPRLVELGTPLLVSTVDSLANGTKLKRRNQNEKSSSKTPRLGPRHCSAPWWRESKVVLHHLRALSPTPGMTTMMRREKVRILSGGPLGKKNAPPGEPGTYIGSRAGQLAVLCSKGTLFGIQHVEWPIGTSISTHELTRELDLKVGDLFV